jgi:hypothetical protein
LLSQIKDDTGTEFNSVNERKSFITDFYRDLYSAPVNLTPLNDNSIAEFLGPEICMSSVVKNAKLTDPEKNLLLNEFSLREMDESVKEAKAATAGGPDGIGNACIKKLWPYIRKPLTSFANECIRRGSLTDNFRTASIKLILKKGDLSKIKNWRPISLLNCLYKVISRAINTRLKKVSNRVLSRAQKGFTSEKYIQECIINIVNNVQRSEQLSIPAFLLAIDQAKAFDSVRHDFMRKCFEFFGFPEQFINILEIFTTNRTASVILEDGNLSQAFNLEIGNTQGNGPSPLQFNICEQILLFKLELNPRIRPISDSGELPITLRTKMLRDFTNADRGNFSYEGNNETNTAEGFADDGTVVALATPEALIEIKMYLTTLNV